VGYRYNGVGDVLGSLDVMVAKKTDVITSMIFVPDVMTFKNVIARFGRNFIVMHYDFDECLGDEESAPMYESPTGSMTTIEYRSKGVVVVMRTKDEVQDINYIDHPFGARESKCKDVKEGPN
jgi:hypothetical protein